MRNCECVYCKNDNEFEIDSYLLEQIANENTCLFIGAGVSTENSNAHRYSFYEQMLEVIGPHRKTSLSFPAAAQIITDMPDGRFRLVKLLQDRFDYINAWSDRRHQSRKFFEEISTIPYISEYITTNWDRNIEDICGAKPFVYSPDMRFWNCAERKVLKIHGTIDDYSSMIINSEDYAACEQKLHNSLIGNKLAELMSQKTCIFVGYSMKDSDFQSVLKFIETELGKFAKTHYFVSPYPSSDPLPKNFRYIQTDGTFFFHKLKLELYKNTEFVPDECFEDIGFALETVIATNSDLLEKYSMKQHPQIILSAMYQNGLTHGFRRMLDLKNHGKYSDLTRVHELYHKYEGFIKEKRKQKEYSESAYFKGYQNSLLFLLLWKEHGPNIPPLYYFEKIGEFDTEDLDEAISGLPSKHKGAYEYCKKISDEEVSSDDMILVRFP